MLAYKAAGKPYVKLMEMEYLTADDNKVNVQADNNKADVEMAKP